MAEQVKPYSESIAGKKQQVEQMFDNIAPTYDFLNHFLSMGIDNLWRSKAISKLKEIKPEKILDVATGTADLAVAAAKKYPSATVEGIDISEKMIAIGRKKLQQKKLDQRVHLAKGDSENLFFADNSFDAVTVAFGVRNFENLQKGLKEMQRVMKPGGMVVVLEFSKPRVFPVKQLFGFYFRFVLPALGKIFSKDKSAYTYLPESVLAFPEREDFLDHLQQAGFSQCNFQSLTFGICCLYTGRK